MLKSRILKTKAGWLWFVTGDRGLLRCTLPQPDRGAAAESLAREFPEARSDRALEPDLARDLEDYFAGKPVRFRVRLDESGLSEFQREVYRSLRRVPAGRTISYGELAAAAGRPRAARGVGVCMRKNPFPPIVPCHRVLGSNGALTGFSAVGGVDFKRRMLAMEGVEGL
ncbi:MAG: methylated-DNA--[protein]-cysteine S-methyltransferase [Planctomycetes bacterium]|nr:methylated-DNA--[protein]-cysteine S-methyltransferase [Planctomycetota bacterium]